MKSSIKGCWFQSPQNERRERVGKKYQLAIKIKGRRVWDTNMRGQGWRENVTVKQPMRGDRGRSLL